MKCKACNFDVDVEGKELCWYCYGIRNRGSSRFVLFLSLLDNGNKFVTVDEALSITNKYRDTIGKPHTTRKAVYLILYKYSRFYNDAAKRGSGYLLLKSKTSFSKLNKKHAKTRTTGACNAIMYKYKISRRLEKRVNGQLKRWRLGFTIYIKSKHGKNILLTATEKEKSRMIREKIRADEYDLFEFLLV